jgi:phosphate/phosphite/phosphonate ABC transporter binding protein
VKRILISLVIALALTTFLPTAFSAGGPGEKTESPRVRAFSIGIIPFYSPEQIWQLYAPFIDYLNKTTGATWELKLYHNHDSIIDALCSGGVSVALLGPVPLGRAHQKCRAAPLVVSLGSDGKPFYRSVIVAGDKTIQSLNDLRGKTFALFKGSTAAHIIPLQMLKDGGIPAEAIHPVFYESQTSIMNALLKHEVAAAGIKKSLFEKFRGEPLRVLKTSDPLPHFSFCATQALDSRARKAFTGVLARLKPLTSDRDRLQVHGWDDEIKNGFILPTGAYLEDVLKVHRIYREIMHEDQ